LKRARFLREAGRNQLILGSLNFWTHHIDASAFFPSEMDALFLKNLDFERLRNQAAFFENI